MVKSLLSKLGKSLKRGALIVGAVASLGVAGCDLNGPKPVPNYAPEITSTPVTQVYEGTAYNYDVDATDSEGDKLTYSLPVAPSWLSINSDTGLISGTAPTVGSDALENITVEVSDGINSPVKQNYTLTEINDPLLDDYIDISGKLEDCENDGTGRIGKVKVYENKDVSGNFINPIQNKNNPGEYEFSTSADGTFSFTLDKLVNSDSSDKIYLRAITGTFSSNPTSYTRTIELSATDNNPIIDTKGNPAVRVTPYPTFDTDNDLDTDTTDYQRFKEFMNQINASYRGLRGFDLSQIQGIEILKGNPLWKVGDPEFNFTSGDQTFLKSKIDDQNDIGVYVEKRDLNGSHPGWIDVQLDDNLPGQDPPVNKHYSTTLVPGQITPDLGWIIVTPNDSSDSETRFFWDFDSGKIKRARIDLGVVNEGVPTHEFGHAFIAANPLTGGHSTILLNPLTIMTASPGRSTPGIADEKATKIVYEDTYQFGEDLNDILGTTF